MVQELEDDEADLSLLKTTHQPLYRSLFPEWGRVHADFLNFTTSTDKGPKSTKQMRNSNAPSQKSLKKSYPMCLTYFKPLNLCIFALVSEIVIHVVQQSGNKKVFNQVARHKINQNNEFIPTCLEVALHKVSGRLLVCLAVQSSKLNKADQYDNYVIVYEFD